MTGVVTVSTQIYSTYIQHLTSTQMLTGYIYLIIVNYSIKKKIQYPPTYLHCVFGVVFKFNIHKCHKGRSHFGKHCHTLRNTIGKLQDSNNQTLKRNAVQLSGAFITTASNSPKPQTKFRGL